MRGGARALPAEEEEKEEEEEEEEEEDGEETELESGDTQVTPRGQVPPPRRPLTGGCQPDDGYVGSACRWPGDATAVLPTAICNGDSTGGTQGGTHPG